MMIFSPIAECGKGSWGGGEDKEKTLLLGSRQRNPIFLSANDDDPQTHSSVRQMGSRQALNNNKKKTTFILDQVGSKWDEATGVYIKFL